MREKITKLFQEVGDDYRRRGVAELEIHLGHDIHAFFRLSKDPTRVIHIQGYPGMSTDDEARVWARMMNYDRMIKIRKSGASAGNEHGATTQAFPNFELGIMIPYNPKILENRLEGNVPELR